MAYDTPPRPQIGMMHTSYGIHEDSGTNDDALEAAVRSDPGNRVVDSTRSQYGWTNKVHMVDRDGNYTTAILDRNHTVTELRDGYC